MINPAKPEIKAAMPRTYTTLWDTIIKTQNSGGRPDSAADNAAAIRGIAADTDAATRVAPEFCIVGGQLRT